MNVFYTIALQLKTRYVKNSQLTWLLIMILKASQFVNIHAPSILGRILYRVGGIYYPCSGKQGNNAVG